jgi:hypothetical protein
VATKEIDCWLYNKLTNCLNRIYLIPISNPDFDCALTEEVLFSKVNNGKV